MAGRRNADRCLTMTASAASAEIQFSLNFSAVPLLSVSLCALAERRCMMLSFASKVRRFLVSEDGPTAVEYAVMLALIVIVCLAAIGNIGTNAKTTFENVANSLGSGS